MPDAMYVPTQVSGGGHFISGATMPVHAGLPVQDIPVFTFSAFLLYPVSSP